MNPEFSDIISPRRLRRSPVRASENRQHFQNSSQARILRPPSGRLPPRNIYAPQDGDGHRQFAVGFAMPAEHRQPSRLLPPQPAGLRRPGDLQLAPAAVQLSRSVSTEQPAALRPISLLRPPGGIRPPGAIHVRSKSPTATPLDSLSPRSRGGEIIESPISKRTSGTQMVIPLPGYPYKAAAIPKPTTIPARIAAPSDISKFVGTRVSQVPSTSLLPKPAFMRTFVTSTQDTRQRLAVPSHLDRSPIKLIPTIESILSTSPGRPIPTASLPVARPNTAPVSSKPPFVEQTPTRKTQLPLPRTAIKKRIITDDPSVETYNIGGREVEFAEWVPSPESPQLPKTTRKAVPRPGRAKITKGFVRPSASQLSSPIVKTVQRTKTKKIYEFPDEPSVAAAKEFGAQLKSDLGSFQRMGTDMQELRDRRSAVIRQIKAMYTQGRLEQETAPHLDIDGFREKYGITQSPKMRQLLELTGDWNREILEERQFEDRLTHAVPVVRKDDATKMIATLENLNESPDRASPDVQARRKALELARQAKIDTHKQRMEVQKEYRRLLDERKTNAASRRPYSKQEREEIRKRYQEAQESTYTTPTEEELDNALRMAEVMELEEAGVSMMDSPETTVKVLFPEAVPTTEITGVVGDVLIPAKIPVEEITTISSLDRSTAEIALKASLVPVPVENAANQILKTSLQDMAGRSIPLIQQTLDPIYEIELELNRPKRQNLIQLQGSALPRWFPGFYSIFPGAPGLVQATKSPNLSLLTAWRKMQSTTTV